MHTCYKLEAGALVAVEDPLGDVDDWTRALFEAGYMVQVASAAHHSDGAEITLYENTLGRTPRYYVDVAGKTQSLASLVADDFPALVATLSVIAPLISLIGLDQQVEIQGELLLERDRRAQQR